MTVTYLQHIPQSDGCGVFRILFLWSGSLYKAVWRPLLLYCFLYFSLSILYRFVLVYDEEWKQMFETWCIYVGRFEHKMPLEFLTGFYVTQVLSQWWKGLSWLWWIDTIAMDLAIYLPGPGRAKEVRRYILRMANLSSVLAFTRISTAVAKRFPTHDHLVQAGLMTEKEKARVVALEGVCKHQISWAPLLWAQHQLRMAREQNLVSSDVLYHALNRDIIGLKDKNGGLFDYTWINIPLIYTQLVELSVFAYFYGCTIFGKQYLQPTHYLQGEDGIFTKVPRFTPGAVNLVNYDDTIADIVVPIFAIVKFVVFVGWLNVAEALLNPFGEDDDDYDLNYLIERNVQVGYIQTNGVEDDEKELDDPYKGSLPVSLPHTVESFKSSHEMPYFPTDLMLEGLTEENMSSPEAKEGIDLFDCNSIIVTEDHHLNSTKEDVTSIQMSPAIIRKMSSKSFVSKRRSTIRRNPRYLPSHPSMTSVKSDNVTAKPNPLVRRIQARISLQSPKKGKPK